MSDVTVQQEDVHTSVEVAEEAVVVVVEETSQVVNVDEATFAVEVEGETAFVTVTEESITVVAAGLQGPRGIQGETGPQGPTGATGATGEQGPAGAETYMHSQLAPATVWTISHPLNKQPSVTVLDSSGREIEGSVDHSPGVVVITFGYALSGTAHLN